MKIWLVILTVMLVCQPGDLMQDIMTTAGYDPYMNDPYMNDPMMMGMYDPYDE